MRSAPSGELVVCAQRMAMCFSLRLNGMHGRISWPVRALVVEDHRAVVAVEEVEGEAGEVEVVVVIQEAQKEKIRVISSVLSVNSLDIMPIGVQIRSRRRKLTIVKLR
jgi:hypothetical protein